jgi:HK97 family phage portal protein
MSHDLAPRPGLIERARMWVSRLLVPVPLVATSGAPIGARPQYSARTAMSSAAAFPWVWAAVQAIATDLSGLPLRAMRETVKTEGRRRRVEVEFDDAHPILRLLQRPNPRESGVRFRRQVYADFVLTGNAYVWRTGEGVGAILQRLHPAHVEPMISQRTGLVEGYRFGDRTLSADEVLHIADISWTDDASAVLGESVIRCLHSGLVASKESRAQAAKAAKRGRLEMLLSPSDPIANMGREAGERLKEAYEAAVQNGDGVVVLNKAIEATPLSFSPRELEYQALNEQVRDEISAAMGVPPVRLGLPTANYGTAKQQMRQYMERLQRIGCLFDDEISRLVVGEDVRIVHDFTDVEALQTSVTERQMRASVWVTGFGVTPKDAARYEGFDDAPIPEGVTSDDVKAPRRPATEVEEPQAAGLRLEHAVARYLLLAADRYQAAALDGVLEDGAWLLVERGRMLAALEQACVEAKRADATAAHVTELLAETVRQYAETRDADAALGVRTLRAFGIDHARALARALEAA